MINLWTKMIYMIRLSQRRSPKGLFITKNVWGGSKIKTLKDRIKPKFKNWKIAIALWGRSTERRSWRARSCTPSYKVLLATVHASRKKLQLCGPARCGTREPRHGPLKVDFWTFSSFNFTSKLRQTSTSSQNLQSSLLTFF